MIGALTLAPLLALAGPAPAASARCSIIWSFDWLREDTLGHVIAIAGGDSAIGAHWARPPSWDSFPPPRNEEQRRNREALPRTGFVYGQWGDVIESENTAAGARALFIRWNTGGLCENLPSGRARWIEPGTRFFLEGRPRLDTLAPRGVPVYDITGTSNVYEPTWWQRRDSTSRALTVDEYARFYRALPLRSEWFADAARTAGKVRSWASANPEIARRSPVRHILEEMEVQLEFRLR